MAKIMKNFTCTLKSVYNPNKPIQIKVKRKAETLEDALKWVKQLSAMNNETVQYYDFRFKGEIIQT